MAAFPVNIIPDQPSRGYSIATQIKRRDLLSGLNLGAAALLPGAVRANAASAAPSIPRHFQGIEDRTAIQGVCAWPNLQVLSGGTILAMIFNQPCHGLWEGDLDCWASEDAGLTWRYRGRPAEHEPGTNRMNCAAGVAANGDLIVLCSGWADRRRRGAAVMPHRRTLRPWVCRSADLGATWSVSTDFPAPTSAGIGSENEFIPFGNIRAAGDGSLCVSVYLRRDDSRACQLLRSRDDGRTWGEAVELNPQGNETDILHLGEGRWLAACREFGERRDVHLELFSSLDDGFTWVREQPLTLPRQVTGHLSRLSDGRVLLSYGNRCWNNFGVDARLSDDSGSTWSPPVRIADCPRSDCGYPSTVQLSDGRAVTAYYTQVSDDFHYEMRAARWDPSSLSADGTFRFDEQR